MKNIFFSIVIPTYNSKNTIIKCIESCLNQSYKYFEIIIVDDCSIDGTIELVKEYIGENTLTNITIDMLQINKGASSARNRGISLAKGDFISLLDSDDYFSTNKLELLNTILINNNDIDLLGHNYYIVGDELKNVVSTRNTKEREVEQISCNKLLLRNFAVSPSIVFKRTLSVKFDETMRYTEDHDFFIRVCLAQYKIYYVDLTLVGLNRSLLSQGGQSSNNFKMRMGEMKMYLKLYKSNILYLPLIPFLIAFSLSKHFFKIINSFVKLIKRKGIKYVSN